MKWFAMRSMGMTMALTLAAAGAACSDDDNGAQDAGIGADRALISGDGPAPPDGKQPPGPDGPKQPAHWETIAAAGPAVWSFSATLLSDGKVLFVGGMYKPDKKLLGSNEAYIYLPQAKTVLPAGTMSSPRGNHTATLLDDGRVLVVGGRSEYSNYLASAEIFDPSKFDPKNPSAQTFSPAASPAVKRGLHGAVKLNNGKVLVASGYGSGPLSSIELYDPKANSWTLLGNKLAHKRSGATVTLLKNGNVLFAGGYDYTASKYLDSLEIFEASSGSVQAVSAKLTAGRSAHTATLLGDGNVLIVGGTCGGGCKLTNDEIFMPVGNKVKSISNPGVTLMQQAAARLKDGRVLFCGGSTTKHKVVVYDSYGGGSWTNLVSMKHGRHDHTATMLPGGVVVVAGGQQGGAGGAGPAVKQVELFYP